MHPFPSPRDKLVAKWILFILYAVFYLGVVFLNLFWLRRFQMLSLCLFAIPAVLLWLNIRGKVKIGAVVLALLLIPIPSAMLMLGREVFQPVREPVLYRRVLRLYNYPENERIAHFPAEIPAGKTQVQFREWPAFMQAGGYICLCYEAGAEEWDALCERYADSVDKRVEYDASRKPALSPGLHSTGGYFFPVDFSDQYTLLLFRDAPTHVNYGMAYSQADGLLLFFYNYGL